MIYDRCFVIRTFDFYTSFSFTEFEIHFYFKIDANIKILIKSQIDIFCYKINNLYHKNLLPEYCR